MSDLVKIFDRDDFDTYVAALEVAARALNALAEAKLAAAKATSMEATGEDAYSLHADTLATGEYVGVCSAASLVHGMLREARRAIA